MSESGRTPDSGTKSTSATDFALSAEEIETFIEQGYLIMRGALPRDAVESMVHQTLVDKQPMPAFRRRGEPYATDWSADVDFDDPSTWPSTTLYLETKRSLDIENFSPRLWGAVVSLVGDPENISRRALGEQFILNAERVDGPPEALTPTYVGGRFWHIDSPDRNSRLTDRRDALVMLILWSKVEPGGGGTLFSGQTLDHVTRVLAEHPDGVDTTPETWGAQLARQCSDVFEFTGEPGDVLITHSLAMHAPQFNFTGAKRVLENPAILLWEALDYSADNPNPSPVELAVIRRLADASASIINPWSRLRVLGRAFHRERPDYFLPLRKRWLETHEPQARRAVHERDAQLWEGWLVQLSRHIRETHPTPVEALHAAVAIVAELFVLDLELGVRLDEKVSAPDFAATAWSRLVRGFTGAEAQNFALASLLRGLFDEVELLRSSLDGHVFVRVASAIYVDACGARRVFHLDGERDDRFTELPHFDEAPITNGSDAFARSRVSYERAHPLDVEFTPPRPEVFERLAAEERPLVADPAGTDNWGIFLDARLEQLLGKIPVARRGYTRVRKALNPRTTTARVALLFEDRMRAPDAVFSI